MNWLGYTYLYVRCAQGRVGREKGVRRGWTVGPSGCFVRSKTGSFRSFDMNLRLFKETSGNCVQHCQKDLRVVSTINTHSVTRPPQPRLERNGRISASQASTELTEALR